jgi:two-component system sensor histidine kinase AlgZ
MTCAASRLRQWFEEDRRLVRRRAGAHSIEHPFATALVTGLDAAPRRLPMNAISAPNRTDSNVVDPGASAVPPSAAVGRAQPAVTPGPEPASPVDDVFDVCHGALAWRALLIVNAGLVLGVFAAHDRTLDALAVAGPVAIAGLAGTATWLGGVCAARGALAAMAPVGRRLLLPAWGALLGVACAWGLAWVAFAELRASRAVVAALIGAGFAACLAAWIEQRTRKMRPAHDDARLAELQARIRPHFLFNTLNTATALVRVDPAGAEAMLEDLSDLFRAALAEARSATLGEELAVAKQYLAIEQRRFGDRMRVEFDLDPAADGAVLPSLLLQPLVENAVHHGIESLRAGGWIRVRTRAGRDAVTIEIENNVGGPTRPGSGMALANVRERLRLMHDLDGRFDARREDDRFVVRLGAPLKRP